MRDFGKYLHKKVTVKCMDGKTFTGDVMSFGGSVQGEEEYGTAESYISVYPGDACYVLFDHEIEEITIED